MKNSDIALVILVATISVIVSYFVCNAIMGDANEKTAEISYIQRIGVGIENPSEDDFSVYRVNPTVDVWIGSCEEGSFYDKETGKCVEIIKLPEE